MKAVWEIGIAPEIKNSVLILHAAGYSTSIHMRFTSFYVTDLRMTVRLCSKENDGIFLNWPAQGPFKAKYTKISGCRMRQMSLLDFGGPLPSETYDEFIAWANAAAACDARQTEARSVINDIIKMLSTAGQLRRMVPELVQYLPAQIQKDIADQQRASPFPEEWASYPKDKVEKMLAALAEGHLFHGMGKRDVSRQGAAYSWAVSWAVHHTEKA
jgi:hypothetical protein